MKAIYDEARVKKSKVFPHNLRHLFARCYYKITRNIVDLADMLGHSSIETTRIYLKTSLYEHEITVRNDTDLTISDIVVKDELTEDEWQIDILEPGTEEILTAEYTVTAEDVEAGTVVNVAAVEGVNEEGTPVAGEDSSKVRTGTDETMKETTAETESKGSTGTTGSTGSSGSSGSGGSSGGSGTTSTVKTADETPVTTYVLLMMLALCALAGAGAYRRRRKTAEK